jgi:hypothetical protein
MGNFVASSPSSPRQVLSRCLHPAGVMEQSLTKSAADVSPPLGLSKRCVPVALVASPVASALHTPKNTLKGVFQSLKRAVWREKSTRLARLLPRTASPVILSCVAGRRNLNHPVVRSSCSPRVQ